MHGVSAMDVVTLEQLAQFLIGDSEAPLIQLNPDDVRTGLQECRSSIVGCMFGGKEINFNGFKAAMVKVWKCGNFELQKLDEHFFQVFFGTDELVEYVLQSGPWNFDNQLVQFRAWDESRMITATDMEVKYF